MDIFWIVEKLILLLRINFIYNLIKYFCYKFFCSKKDKSISKEKVMSELSGYGQWVEIEEI